MASRWPSLAAKTPMLGWSWSWLCLHRDSPLSFLPLLLCSGERPPPPPPPPPPHTHTHPHAHKVPHPPPTQPLAHKLPSPCLARSQKNAAGQFDFRGLVASPDGKTMFQTSRAGVPATEADVYAMGKEAGEQLKAEAGPSFFTW